MSEASAFDSSAVANMDDAIMKQSEAIQNEVASQQPLVCDRASITSLIKEYSNNMSPDSAPFLAKAKELSQTYGWIRRIRGDGNCFYRALIFAQLEYCLRNRDELLKFQKITNGWKDRLIKLGFPDFTTEDFCDTLTSFVDQIANGTVNDQGLFDAANESGTSNYFVCFMRLVTSGYLQENSEFYSNFVEGERTVKEFCRQEIEPMFQVCDHLCISALSQALGLSFRIEYMDRSEAPSGISHHDFTGESNEKESDGADQQPQPKLHFLYRHDHYEVLYLK
jgi:ubiquitin thioesterase protein OTUB1